MNEYTVHGFHCETSANHAREAILYACRKYAVGCHSSQTEDIRELTDGTWTLTLRIWTKEEGRNAIKLASYPRTNDGGSLEVEGATTARDLGRCEAALPFPFMQSWRLICHNEATETWDYGCVHEHVKRRHTCPEHRPEPNAVGCRECFELGHECPLVAHQVK